MRSLVLFAVFFFTQCLFAGGISEATLKGVSNFYDRVVATLTPSNVPFANIYKNKLTLERWGCERKDFDYYPSVFLVAAQLDFHMVDEHPPRLIAVYNHRLRSYNGTNNVQRVPAWTPQRAVEQAKEYISVLGVSLPTNMYVKSVLYGKNKEPAWVVVWEPRVNNIGYDSFINYEAQQIEVRISEKYGFIGFYGRYDYPAPKRMDVKISAEAAADKAVLAVPLIQRSPYYLQCRLPGFKVSGVLKAELLIAAPNWLLDPKRAIWLRRGVPEETRLCWVVSLASEYTGKTEPGELLVPPFFRVYIDAATGEIVGANFT
jgi:hypothetical protein